MMRSATFGGLVIGSLLAVFVFAIKYEVQDLEVDVANLNRSIERERQSIHVLLAEWSHLNDPARIQELAREHLGLGGISAGQVAEIEQIPMRIDTPDRLARIQNAVREFLTNKLHE